MTYYIDTNYFLRFFLDDNKKQAQEVRELFLRASTGEVRLISSIVVFLEVYWVLESFYSFPKSQIIESLRAIIKMNFIEFEKQKVISRAIEIFNDNNIDLEDCFHLAYLLEDSEKSIKLATFDKKLKNAHGALQD